MAFVAVLRRVGPRIAIAYEALALGRGGDGNVSDELGVRQAGVDHGGVVHAERLWMSRISTQKSAETSKVNAIESDQQMKYVRTAVGGRSMLLCAIPMAQWLPIHPCMNPPCAIAVSGATSRLVSTTSPVALFVLYKRNGNVVQQTSYRKW